MTFKNRWYQDEGVDAALKQDNSIVVMPTGSGKSVVCASLVEKTDHGVLVLQPSLEILKSNYLKAAAKGMQAEIYSASANRKDVGHVTYATIGSIIKDLRYFKHVKTLIIDEAHLVNAKGGMYEQLIATLKPDRLIGMTATPYRQHSTSMGTNMRIITRTKPKIFKQISYVVNPYQLLREGYLMAPVVHQLKADTSMLRPNTTGGEFTDRSKTAFSKQNRIVHRIVDVAKQSGKNHQLVFVDSVAESLEVVGLLNAAGIKATEISAETHARDREYRLAAFEGGTFGAMVNVRTLTTGYDFPALDCIIDGATTMSAALHYQKNGRIYRPFEKDPVIYDLAGNVHRLGDPLKYAMLKDSTGRYEVFSDRGRVTSRIQEAFPECDTVLGFGVHIGKRLADLPQDYVEYMINKLAADRDWKHIFYSEKVRRRIVAAMTNPQQAVA